ncbi:alpha/beta hydrolase [Chitinophagaceae bacterium LB-8]|uniref:Alpha/beta hydrolase n=1 Tax=Paraflavisolibacter caeni TaxID=2982496 RepID=A0A9X2XNV4_9BACT|nr:alpha/beta hydrolase [Paraflavisolibacter caeni]MCU7549733.1 alpha/beta hydrolase [Paraflavisolibacter caeni]
MWHFFPGQYMPSYQVNRALTQAHYGGGEFAEILEVASEITPGDNESFHQAWAKMGNKVFDLAENYLSDHKNVSARRTYLRAFNYLRTSEFFLKPSDNRKQPSYMKAKDAFQKAISLFDNKPKQVRVPFEGSFLPGYLFLPEGVKNPPLMIMFGGLDSLAEELYFGPCQHLNERGIALLAMDGPGQGASLRFNHIYTRYDFNVAGSAVLDWALANLQDEVDTLSIGIMAVSMGGYMAARCAAFEPRFKICVVWGAVWSYYDIWKNRLDNHPLAEIVMHIVGAQNMADARERLKMFTLDGVAEKISMPTYVLHGEDDRQNFVENAYKLRDALTCEKVVEIVPKESSGSAHCQIDDFTKTFNMYDWIQKKMYGVGNAASSEQKELKAETFNA